jgi:O-acetylhomoserine (thiol)-lyase
MPSARPEGVDGFWDNDMHNKEAQGASHELVQVRSALDEKLFREEMDFLGRSPQIVRRKVFSSLHLPPGFAMNARRFQKFQKGRFSMTRTPGFNTLAVHAGAKPDPATGARATPIYQTTSFVFDDADHAASLFGLKAFGNIYTRIMNPTQAVLEERVAALEGGTAALAVASGHAAQVLVFHNLMQPGDNFIAANKLYGGSINQFGHAFKNFGWNVRWADTNDISTFESQIDDRTKAIFIESLANPGGTFVDIEKIAEIARKHGLPLIVDNTLASPYLIRPIEHGADIVVHSLTKFIGGHGNSIGGAIVDGGTFDWSKSGKYPMLSEPRPEYGGLVLHETFGNFAFAIAARVLGLRDIGPAISPFNAFLILTGLETLPLRMQRHCDNAVTVAAWLSNHPKVAWVNYPGLPSDKNNALQKKYSPLGAGAVFTFGLKGGYAAGVKFVEALELFSHLANVGDTKSLVIHPASTTHRQLSDEQKVAAGAGPDTVRLSVGIEDVNDIVADLEQALGKV